MILSDTPLTTSMNRWLRLRRFWLGIGLLVLALMCLGVGYTLPYGITHTLNGQSLPAYFVWLDHFPRVSALPGATGTLAGTLNRPTSNKIWLENNIGAQVRVKFAGAILYEGAASVEIQLPENAADPIPFEVAYQMPTEPQSGAQLGFMQTGLLGNRYVQPAWDFVPRSFIQEMARVGFWVFLAAGIIAMILAFRWTRRAVLACSVIWLLAIVVQGITLTEKLNSGSIWWGMEHTWDNYVFMGRSWLEGTKPIPGQESQQGNFIYLGVATLLLGPEVSAMYRLNTIAGSAVPVLLLLATWGLFQRPEPGILTGILAALFMPLVHYQQSLQPESIANLVIAILLGMGVVLLRKPHWSLALLAGLLVGWLGILRGSWLIFIAWVWVALWFSTSLTWRRRIIYGGVAAVGLVMALAPMIYLNFSAGFYMLTPSKSEVHLFRANNLDSMGLTSYLGVSEKWALARGRDWDAALRRDVARDPMRVVELTFRRLGLIWQSEEHSDSAQTDYESYGYRLSFMTRLLSLRLNVTVRTLLAVALFGVIAGILAKDWRAMLLLFLGAGAWGITLLPFYTLGRTRIGMVIFLLPLAGYTLAQLWAWRKQRRKLTQWLLIGVVLNGLILWSADWLTNYMPRPQVIRESEIPAEFVPLDAIYNQEIQLRGAVFYESDYRANGYITFELFWETLKTPPEDYVVTFRLIDTVTQAIVKIQDVTLGASRPPEWKTTRWNTGDLFFEQYFLSLPEQTGAYAVFVGVYSQAQQQAISVMSSAEVQNNHVRVMAVAVLEQLPEPVLAAPIALWDNQLALIAADCELSDNDLSLNLEWQIVAPIRRDWRFFVHLQTPDGTLIPTQDARLDAALPLDALPIYSRLQTQHTFNNVPADTQVFIGFYDAATQQRFAIKSRDAVSDMRLPFVCS